ncbi:hypothetical protein ACRAKI_22330 [Saccharothrix isguenensis]
MKPDLGDTVTVIRRRTDVIFGSVMAAVAFAIAIFIVVSPSPHPDSTYADRLTALVINVCVVWPGLLATIHPRAEVRQRGLVVVNWFTKSWVPWSSVDSVVVDDRLAVLLRNGRRINIAAGATSLASSVTGYRMQESMKRRIEKARQDNPDADDQVLTRLDVWPLHFLATWAVLLTIGWLVGG